MDTNVNASKITVFMSAPVIQSFFKHININGPAR